MVETVAVAVGGADVSADAEVGETVGGDAAGTGEGGEVEEAGAAGEAGVVEEAEVVEEGVSGSRVPISQPEARGRCSSNFSQPSPMVPSLHVCFSTAGYCPCKRTAKGAVRVTGTPLFFTSCWYIWRRESSICDGNCDGISKANDYDTLVTRPRGTYCCVDAEYLGCSLIVLRHALFLGEFISAGDARSWKDHRGLLSSHCSVFISSLSHQSLAPGNSAIRKNEKMKPYIDRLG